jgi:BlaR1 peptidase M56/HEAT repeat protein
VLAGVVSVGRAVPAPVAWQMEVNALCQRLRILREVRLRIVACDTSPVVTGLWRPTILLPNSARGWDAEQRRSVLVHELAHVRRDDLRTQAIGQLACSIYWFNPLMWLAFAQLRVECERACDDEVLRSGALPSAYAAHLVDIARELSPSLRPLPALAMARSSQLESRVLAVLAVGRSRVPARGTRWAVAALVAFTMAVALGASPREYSATQAMKPAAVVSRLVTESSPVEREAGIAPFESALDDVDQDVREKAALALGFSSSPDAIPGLLKALADPDSQVREKAAIGLALRRDARVTSALIAAMDDPDPQVREKAAMSLGTSGDLRAAAVLERALQDPDSQVREQAATGLILLHGSPQDVARAERVRNGLGGLAGFLISLAQ